MKRILHHGSGIISPKYNSSELIWYTIPVIVNGDVQKKYSVKVINRKAFNTEDSVNGATITKRKVKKNVPLNVRYQKNKFCTVQKGRVTKF